MFNTQSPEFGKADLSNCEREKINLPGSIQPHGALLVLAESNLAVVQASEGASAFLDLDFPVLGAALSRISPTLAAGLPRHLGDTLDQIPIAIRCHAGRSGAQFDALVHRPPGGGLVVELERAGPPTDARAALEVAFTTIVTSLSLRALCDSVAGIFKGLTGYDRVMVYRFDDAGHGEVLAEQREPGLEPYLGNRYPASDIPQIARRLYERNRIRVLVDVDYVPSKLTPALSPFTNQPLDMSMCCLRSMSPIHIQYLKNMGVGATLVVSIMVGGKLWGLISCHHYVPRMVHFEMRSICELLAETVGTRIAALESFSQGQAELLVRRLEQRMIEASARDGDWRNGLFDRSEAVLLPVNASGAALLFDGQILTAGEVPATHQLRAIGAWLDTQHHAPVTATASLGLSVAGFAAISHMASGVLAARISASGEYLVWFRPEQIRTVTWGGNPFKPVAIGNDPADLSPRRSFSQWHQLVEGTAEPWSATDLAAAQMIGDSIADVVLQARSLRMLIVQHQLAETARQIGAANQPVLIADQNGDVLLCNDALRRLVPPHHPVMVKLEDLAGILQDKPEIIRRLHELLAHRRIWRGEVVLAAAVDTPATLLVRADPVFSAPDRVLGYVVLFTDISDRKSAEHARRRFQEGVVSMRPVMPGRLDAKTDVVLQSLLSTVVENAQLAALEITDGAQQAEMPAMLASLQASVTRTAEVLAHLLWHVNTSADPG